MSCNTCWYNILRNILILLIKRLGSNKKFGLWEGSALEMLKVLCCLNWEVTEFHLKEKIHITYKSNSCKLSWVSTGLCSNRPQMLQLTDFFMRATSMTLKNLLARISRIGNLRHLGDFPKSITLIICINSC